MVIEDFRLRVTANAIVNVRIKSEKYHVIVFNNDFLTESLE